MWSSKHGHQPGFMRVPHDDSNSLATYTTLLPLLFIACTMFWYLVIVY